MTRILDYLGYSTPTEIVPLLTMIAIEEDIGMKANEIFNIVHELYCSQDDIIEDF